MQSNVYIKWGLFKEKVINIENVRKIVIIRLMTGRSQMSIMR